MLALEHIKVIDTTISGAGNFATQILADLGADVIRVVPLHGSGSAYGPSDTDKRNLSVDFMNRNKRSIAVNLKSAEGRQAFLRMAGHADVIVEGGRPGAARRLGVGYDEVKKLNPGIVYCSVSGYGQDGPYAQVPGHNVNYIGYAGVLSIVGQLDGPPVIPDMYIGVMAGAALHSVVGILTAIVARERTGWGQLIDVSCTDAALALNATALSLALSSGVRFDRGGMPTCGAYPCYSAYQAKDGKWLTLGCLEPWFWESACKVLGLGLYAKEAPLPPDAFLKKRPDDPRYAEIRKALEDKFRERGRDEWVAELQKNDVPAGPAYDMDEVIADPHLSQRMIIEAEVPGIGTVRQPGFPIKFSETPAQFRMSAPAPGQHTDDTLKSVGYSAAEIAGLREKRAVG